MKKFNRSIYVIAFLLIANTTFAQQEDMRGQFNFGLKAGANFSNVWDSKADDFSARGKFGFAGGAFLTIPLGDLLGLQPEVMFSQKGYRSSGSIFGISNYEMKRTSNYLDIPLLLAIRPIPAVSILIGPQFSFLLWQRDEFTSGSFSSDQEKTFDTNIRKNRLGMHVGLDLNFNHIVISPRAAIDFQDNKKDGSSTDPRYKLFYFQLTLGYRF